MTTRAVTCPYCHRPADLVGGTAIYPHRPDLFDLNFWLCTPCDAYVGCHKPNRKHGRDGTEPLGRLADRELRAAKRNAHAAFDPLWRDGPLTRKKAYARLADAMGLRADDCHIGMFDVFLCNTVVNLCEDGVLEEGT